ncbi:MAG: hypothetical protein RLZZ46_762 [Bacteroidota bacterium]|jgi:hypothetical protein
MNFRIAFLNWHKKFIHVVVNLVLVNCPAEALQDAPFYLL